MAKNPSPRLRFAPLQHITAEPITDPAERASLDEKRRASRDVVQPVGAGGDSASPLPITLPQVMDLCRQLLPKDRLALLKQLLSQQTPEEQLELVKNLVEQSSPDGLCSLQGQLRSRLGQPTS